VIALAERLAEGEKDLHESAHLVRLDARFLEAAFDYICGARGVGGFVEGVFVQ